MDTEQVAPGQSFPRNTEQLLQDNVNIAAMRSKAADLQQQARSMIMERPVVAVLTAASIGYLLARIVSRAAR